jgi:hypothetical protein
MEFRSCPAPTEECFKPPGPNVAVAIEQIDVTEDSSRSEGRESADRRGVVCQQCDGQRNGTPDERAKSDYRLMPGPSDN